MGKLPETAAAEALKDFQTTELQAEIERRRNAEKRVNTLRNAIVYYAADWLDEHVTECVSDFDVRGFIEPELPAILADVETRVRRAHSVENARVLAIPRPAKLSDGI